MLACKFNIIIKYLEELCGINDNVVLMFVSAIMTVLNAICVFGLKSLQSLLTILGFDHK